MKMFSLTGLNWTHVTDHIQMKLTLNFITINRIEKLRNIYQTVIQIKASDMYHSFCDGKLLDIHPNQLAIDEQFYLWMMIEHTAFKDPFSSEASYE